MKRAIYLLVLVAAAALVTAACGPSEPARGMQTAGFVPGAQLSADPAEADSSGIVTRRIRAGLEVVPVGSPSPDGRHVSDVDWNTGNLVILDLETGGTREVTHDGSFESKPTIQWAEGSRISPDGRWVAYSWYVRDSTARKEIRAGVRVIPLEGGESRVLVGEEEGYHAAQPFGWSADGTRVAARLTRPDGVNEVRLVGVGNPGPGVVKSLGRVSPTNMALSPDARYVAYDVQREERSPEHTVHILALDGNGDREVTGPGGHNVVIGWEPSGQYLLYYGDHSGSPSIWALKVRGGRPQGEPVLVRSDLWHLIPLGFTASGALLYAVTTGKIDIFTVLTNPETGAPIGQPQSVTPQYQAGTALFPRWSPDGRYLAYRRTPPAGAAPRHSLVIRALESGEFREIPLDLAIVLSPDWSADGRFLVLYGVDGRDRGRSREGIYRIDVQTGEQGFVRRIGSLRGTAWIDDGRTVVYKEAGGGDLPATCRFVAVELASGREREVYRWPCYSADWFWTLSPDRRTIAGIFDSAGDSTRKSWALRLVSLGDGASRDLAPLYPWVGNNAPGTLAVSELYWTPDSRSFRWRGCLTSGQLDQALNRCPNWSFDVATGERRRLADDAPMGSIHPDGRRVAFADGKTAYEVWVMEGYLPIH